MRAGHVRGPSREGAEVGSRGLRPRRRYIPVMLSHREAFEALVAAFSEPVDNPSAAPCVVSLSFGALAPDGTSEVTLASHRAGALVDAKVQELCVLPPDVALDPVSFDAFVRGTRMALAQCDFDAAMPADLVVPSLLRASLREPASIAEAILVRDAQCRALAELEADDLARSHGLPPLVDRTACALLWTLAHDDRADVAEAAARTLRDVGLPETIPYVLLNLEDRQALMATMGGRSWIAEDGRNVDVTIARLLEPLVLRASTPRDAGRVEALAIVGLFDEAHEHAAYEWMFET